MEHQGEQQAANSYIPDNKLWNTGGGIAGPISGAPVKYSSI